MKQSKEGHSSKETHISSSMCGFTLLELLITIVLIGVITTLSMPAMKSVTRRSEGHEIAAQLVHLMNTARDQATRRNKAYGVTLNEFNAGLPTGVIVLNEGPANTCQSLIDRPDQLRRLESIPFGGSTLAETEPSNRPFVGLSGWKSDQGGWQNRALHLCMNPKGGLFVKSGSLYSELTGFLFIGVQQYFSDPLRPLGPPIQVEMTFSSGAKVQR